MVVSDELGVELSDMGVSVPQIIELVLEVLHHLLELPVVLDDLLQLLHVVVGGGLLVEGDHVGALDVIESHEVRALGHLNYTLYSNFNKQFISNIRVIPHLCIS